MLTREGKRLVYRYDAHQLWIDGWGENAFRVRATELNRMPSEDWALEHSTGSDATSAVTVHIDAHGGTITNGHATAIISPAGKLRICNSSGKVLLEEFVRNRRDPTSPDCSALEIEAREFRPIPGGDYRLTMRFESLDRSEKIFGMGQYQQPHLNLKGHDLELAHRNSQASVPFAVSSRGYGILWNNPAIGRAVFGMNVMSFEAYSTKFLDYWVIAGDEPAKILEGYARATGTVPMMPEYGLGFWQCKLRYQTQEELLSIAREYHTRNLPLDVIVADFFHWPLQGEWKFDPTYWPDPEAMVKELRDLGVELMVSIWPTVDPRSENYAEMLREGLLVRVDRGIRTTMDFQGATVHFDATNPAARNYVWAKAKANYHDKGIKLFWLDEAEPEYTVYDFDNYRYYLGPNLAIGNIFPTGYARAFYDGMAASGQRNIVNLIRCAWAGTQRYGALVWSGDIASSWGSFRNQLAAGLSMGLSGMAWWTTDIGGFHGGDPSDPAFRELFTRWFQWGTFCPVMRLHGDREPRQPQQGETGGATCCSGAPNEVWCYGAEVYEICQNYLLLRESLRDYTREQMRLAHEHGTPVMRPLFYDFPSDPNSWEVEDQYMYGPIYLCCPVLEPGMKNRTVYLPPGTSWQQWDGETIFEGGQTIAVETPLKSMPVFIKKTLGDKF